MPLDAPSRPQSASRSRRHRTDVMASFLFEHDLFPKTGSHFAGSCSRLAPMAWRNLITDVAGVRVGHAHDTRLGSGVTAVVFDEPAVASIDIRGGGPATRESDLLAPGRSVERV